MDHDIATAARDEAPAAERSWRSYAIFPGDASRLDAAVEHAVGAAVEHACPQHWAFVRWTGQRGPHLRLALDGGDPDAGLRDALRAGVERAQSAPALKPLLAAPASWRGGDRIAVEALDLGPGEEPAHPLDEVSSAVALAALASLRDGRDRAAHALSLMSATAGAIDADGFWLAFARDWTGGGERGRRLLSQLATNADAHAAELRRRAQALREDHALTAGLERYGEACSDLGDAGAVGHHAHMAANRIGVSPLEEALLALVLAAGSGDAPSRRREDAASRRRDDAASRRGDAASRRREDAPSGPREDAASRWREDAANRRREDAPSGSREDAASCRREDAASRWREDEPALVVLDGASGRVPGAVSLRLRRGEIVALLGPAGAGKTALLAAAGQLPDSELAAESTVRENLDLRLRTAGSDAGADALLEHAGLSDQAGTLAADLGTGERRRLQVACALAGDPDVLLLDEPSAGLSAIDREALWQLLTRRRDAGGTTLLATTSLQDALGGCDRAALVRDGAIAAVATPAELADEHFPPQALHVRVAAEPDRALLDDLPEVSGVWIEERVDHWVVELQTRQPGELRALLRADPDFPEIADVPG